MDKMPSSEFRKAYPSLTKPVAVTALGRVIGLWTPLDRDGAALLDRIGLVADSPEFRNPFRPVPKPSQKGK